MTQTRVFETVQTHRYEEGTHDEIVAKLEANGWIVMNPDSEPGQVTRLRHPDLTGTYRYVEQEEG
jgi:hypothetical protein